MLPRKTLTKRQKKEASKNRLGLILVFIGLALISFSLIVAVFLVKDPLFVSPLSKDQTSINLKIEKILKEKKISYKSIITSPDLSFVIRLDKDHEVIIDSNKDIDSQLSSLQLILTQLKIEGKTFKRLDFRFQKPIISF